MTATPYASRSRRLLVGGGLTALFLLLGVLALQAYGLGPSLFLFALAGVGVVDLLRR